jgi:butyryl-CoA dehydrogenase
MADFVNHRDLEFLLYECLNVEQLCQRERFEEHDRETFDAVIEMAYRLAKDKFEPHAHKLDENEPTFDGERVHILPEVKEAIDAYVESGLLKGHADVELGGMQLPWTIMQTCLGMFLAANAPTAAYPFLTGAAANLLQAFGAEELQERYLQPMFDGRFFGTMCLSEPHAGSSLTDLRTRAVPQEDGSYEIQGSKMWISGGEHDLSENIVHMVLAKLPDAPPGVRGISLFLVPKYRVEGDGSIGEYNNVTLAGVNHKMGYRGTINTLLNFGEQGSCKGWLVGQEHRGLKAMFHMMNEARIGVGYGAVMMGVAGYQHSLEYARERPQGRLPSNKNPETPQVMLIEHADVRRMLLAQKAYTEGALALCLYAAQLVDDEKTHPDQHARQEASELLQILTPLCKAWPSEYCTKANDLAIQILGGAGYTRDYPVERLYRDNRLNPIHEGTNAIQALDLLGRKVMGNQGATLRLLLSRIQETLAETKGQAELEEFRKALRSACDTVGVTTMALGQAAMEGKIDLFLANATLYLEMLGHTVIAWMWLWQTSIALQQKEEASEQDKAFYDGKLRACQYFFRWELPRIEHNATLLQSLDDTCFAMPLDSF